MRRFFTLLTVFTLSLLTVFAQERAVDVNGNFRGVIRLKLQDHSVSKLQNMHTRGANSDNTITTNGKNYVETSIANLDKLNKKFGVVEYKRVFRYAGKFEERHREFGLHRWYEISFGEDIELSTILAAFKGVAEVRFVEPLAKYSLTSVAPTPKVNDSKVLSSTNDPKLSDQWHYHNTGQNGGTVDADIDLPEAWAIETGSSQVIVAVEDGGIDVDHPDLIGNMWINTGEIPGNGIDDDNNGYVDDVHGYNFGDGQGTITQDDHGTHVAGTIAAETNNGIGVAGIAGGTGNNDGVRIMSCQVFGSSSQGGFEEAFVYAADMGAHISQNSWGGGGESQAINDAIDYFIANGGSAGSPMQGGVVIVAAGNSNTSTGTSIWPAAYVNAIAVAATNKNDAKSYYSNYGSWVDISAPGGELESTNNDPTAIHSTISNGGYGVMQGTSMACPHVSGVAALIVSHFAGNITPGEVRSRLLTYVDDISAQNPSFNGQLGSGRLNAYAALTGATPPEPPASYCTSKGNDASYEWIAKVDIGSFTNSSSGAGYTDFTGQTVELTAGQSYNVTLTPGFSGQSYDEYWKIWIDYNADGDFDDSGELVFDAGSLSKTAVSGTINIPSGASGETRMRVSMKYNGAQTACESFSYGEVEDYTVSFGGTPADTQAPTAPANLSASNVTQTTVDLSWSASTDNVGVTAYEVFRNGTSVGTTANTSAQITGLTASTAYAFTVKAKDAAGNVSAASNSVNVTTDAAPDTQAPTAPANLSASNVTQTTVDLSWSASTDNVGVAAYEIFRNGTSVGTTANTSAQITGLTASTAYTFTVKAKDAAGNVSAASNSVNVTTGAAADTQAPTAPANLSASNVTQTTVDLSWSASTDNVGVTAYEIFRNGTSVGTTAGTSTQVTGLAAATSYSFYVKAKDAAGNVSAASNTVNETTLPESTGDCYVSDVTLSLTFDNYPAETSWDVKDAGGSVVYSGNNYSAKGATITKVFVLTDGDFTFTIYDSYGDGINSGYGSGSYTLTDGNGTQVATGGTFTSSEATAFCISGSGSTPGGDTGMPTGYCASKGGNASYEWIDLVQLGSINKTSGNDGGYADYTSMSTNLTAGNQYTINFSAGFKSSSYTEFWHIYIDYNRDGDFNDAGEEVVTGSSTSSGTLSGTFTVPAGASLGTTRMRVTMKYNAAATPCETFSYGEVEDYAIVIGNSTYSLTGQDQTTAMGEMLGNEVSKNFTMYPNPATNMINIVADNNSELVNVMVVNMQGAVVHQQMVNDNAARIDISQLPVGVYSVRMSDGQKEMIHKLVKH